MEPRGSRDERSVVLLDVLARMDTAEERRTFLEAVCEGEPVVAAEFLQTATLNDRTGGTQPAGVEPPAIRRGLLAERFELVRKLGEGGIAVVYEAIDRKLQERRALKFPRRGHSHSIPPEARSAMRVTADRPGRFPFKCTLEHNGKVITLGDPADPLSAAGGELEIGPES